MEDFKNILEKEYGNITKIDQDDNKVDLKKENKKITSTNINNNNNENSNSSDDEIDVNSCKICDFKSHVPKKIIKQLKNDKIKINKVYDFHGETDIESCLNKCMVEVDNYKYKCIRIITGKGTGKVKTKVYKGLKKHLSFIGICSTKMNNAGSFHIIFKYLLEK